MLKDIIENNKKNHTTLLTLYVVLKHYLDCKNEGKEDNGLEKKEVNRRFADIAKEVGIKNKFYQSYLQRHTGDWYDAENGWYMIKTGFVEELTNAEVEDACNLIYNYLNESKKIYETFLDELRKLEEDRDPERNYEYIIELFENKKRFRNFGQIFEVLSYSILKVYFESFGFQLKRFSVSFSNDGGMDFISGTGIYQVTAMASKSKIDDDLEKLPDIKRVYVMLKLSDRMRCEYMANASITEIITAEDLKNHFLGWLYARGKFNMNFTGRIIETIHDEMKREIG